MNIFFQLNKIRKKNFNWKLDKFEFKNYIVINNLNKIKLFYLKIKRIYINKF